MILDTIRNWLTGSGMSDAEIAALCIIGVIGSMCAILGKMELGKRW